MYLHHELREVDDSRQDEALKRISMLHHLMCKHDGFVRSLACRYLGNTTQYAWLRMWRTSADHVEFRKTQAAVGFASTRPDGLYWPLPGGIASDAHWNSVSHAGQEGVGNYLLRIAFTVPPNASDQFLDFQSLVAEAALESNSITSSLLFEVVPQSGYRETEKTYLILMRTQDIDAYREFLAVAPRLVSRNATLADAGYKPLVTECYAILEELAAP